MKEEKDRNRIRNSDSEKGMKRIRIRLFSWNDVSYERRVSSTDNKRIVKKDDDSPRINEYDE
jgi:hypothetical protein